MNRPESAKAANEPIADRDRIARAYSSAPWWYDVRGFFILTFAYRSSLAAQVRFFGTNMRGRHLEVAIGTGTLASIILRWRKRKRLPEVHLVGIDYAEPMLAGARKRFADRRDIELERADVAALPYASQSFDSVNVANAIHCLPDPDAGMHEIFRVMKPGAMLAANVLLFPRGPEPLKSMAERINAWGMRRGILVRPYAAEDIRTRLKSAGFEIVSEEVLGNTYNVRARRPD